MNGRGPEKGSLFRKRVGEETWQERCASVQTSQKVRGYRVDKTEAGKGLDKMKATRGLRCNSFMPHEMVAFSSRASLNAYAIRVHAESVCYVPRMLNVFTDLKKRMALSVWGR